MDNEVPVYMFFGFMDSGKTTLVKETLFRNHFASECTSFLLIVCEDGDEEYDKKQVEAIGGHLEYLEKHDDLNCDKLVELNDKYHPEAVFIEYNGTWEVGPFFEMDGPEEWTVVQSLCTVDATTFEMYMLNMRSMMAEQIHRADVVIINRCTDDVNKRKFRANVKSINRPANIVYERTDGSIDDREDELPFDISKDEIEISDADYAVWFMDCMDNPKKYDGKTVSFLGLVYNPPEGEGKLKHGVIVPGRFAMTCCVEDIQFLGMKCKYKDENVPGHKTWINIKAKVKNEFAIEYHGKGPVLYPVSVTPGEKPADELVYFS